ncbi:MAG: T9SS type A sorting domain-containing protein [Prevotellaceae bacterium]|jgi:hypothetical protein|nr:T9SS type A sorting domain-containing protein [Prevotellaceae bacterium]
MMKQFIQVFKNLVLTGVLLLFSQNMYAENNGWSNSVVKINGTYYLLNKGTNDTNGVNDWYPSNGSPAMPNGITLPDFGTVTTLNITEAWAGGWGTDGQAWYDGSDSFVFYYRVYQTGTTSSWTQIVLNQVWYTNNNMLANNTAIGGDLLSGLASGNYTLEMAVSKKSYWGTGNYTCYNGDQVNQTITEKSFKATFTIATPITFTIPERGEWHLVSTPLAQADLNKFTFGKKPGVVLRKLISTATETIWQSYTSAATPLDAGDAFAYWINPTTVDASVLEGLGGKIIFDPDLAGDIVGKTIAANQKFTLTGNPFTESFSFANLSTENSDIKDTGYYDDPDHDGQNYQLIASGTIEPWQGFIVESKGLAGGILTFDKSKLISAKAPAKSVKTVSTTELITITATNEAGSLWTYIRKKDTGSNIFGNADGSFMESPANEFVQIYSLKPDANGTIQKAAMNTLNTYEAQIPVGVQTAYSGTATLNLTGMDTWNAYVVLIDKLLNKKIDLTGKASVDYSFESAGSTADRFVIATSKTTMGLDDITAANAKVQTYVQDRIIHVVSPADNPVKSVEVYNLNGAVVNAKQALPAGVYVVKIAAQKGTETVKVIVK